MITKAQIVKAIGTNKFNLNVEKSNAEKGLVFYDDKCTVAAKQLEQFLADEIKFEDMNITARSYFFDAPSWWSQGT